MSLILELPADLEKELAEQAAKLRIPLEEYAIRVLAGAGTGESKPQNGADLVAYWKQEGLVGTRADIVDAANHARAVRREAETRTR